MFFSPGFDVSNSDVRDEEAEFPPERDDGEWRFRFVSGLK